MALFLLFALRVNEADRLLLRGYGYVDSLVRSRQANGTSGEKKHSTFEEKQD